MKTKQPSTDPLVQVVMEEPLVQDEVDLRRYRDVLWRRKWEVLLVVVLVVGAAALYTMLQTNRYRATTEVLLTPSTAEQMLISGDSTPSNQNANPVHVQTEIAYMQSGSVRDAVRQALGYEPSVSIAAVPDTEAVDIRATSDDALRAAKDATVYATTYIDIRRILLRNQYTAAGDQVQHQVTDLTKQLGEIEAPLDRLDAKIAATQDPGRLATLAARRASVEAGLRTERDSIVGRLERAKDRTASLDLAASSVATSGAQIISAAEVPDSPFTPQPLRNGILAIIVGLVLGAAFAFLRETLDDRVRSDSAIESITGWTVIGELPRQRRSRG